MKKTNKNTLFGMSFLIFSLFQPVNLFAEEINGIKKGEIKVIPYSEVSRLGLSGKDVIIERSTIETFKERNRMGGNQDSKDIKGDWLCSNYIVHKKPLYISGCPIGMNLDNSYDPRTEPEKSKKEKEIMLRWVGLYKTVPFKERNYNENYLESKINNFKIPNSCRWTGENNSYQYLQAANGYRADEYYLNTSTPNKHQILKVDEQRDFTGNYRRCYPKCEKIEDYLKKSGSFVELERKKCARGSGEYIKRAKYHYTLPKGVPHNRNGYYISPEDCNAQNEILKTYNGIYDINTCVEEKDEDIKSYYYYDNFHFDESAIKAVISLGFPTYEKVPTSRFLRGIFSGKSTTNIANKKYLNPETGGLKVIYNNLFNGRNVEDITQFKIVITKKGMDNIKENQNPIQKAFGSEIHKFYEGAINNCANSATCSTRSNNTALLSAMNDYRNDLAIGVIFQHKNNVGTSHDGDPNGPVFALRKVEGFGNYLLKITDGIVFQKDLHNKNCKILSLDTTKDYLEDINGRAFIQCADLNENVEDDAEKINYNSINWSNLVDEIDVTDKIKRGEIPYIYFISNDNKTPGHFNINFVVSYKQVQETKENIRNPDGSGIDIIYQ